MARELGDRLQAPEQEGGRQCWICLQAEEEGLIAPCHCTGSMKWVHRECLNRWRIDATNPKSFTNCRHCNFNFRLVLQRDPTQDESALRARKQRFLFKTTSSFISMCALLQVSLILLAMVIRAVDPQEQLVTLLNFQQIETAPPAGKGDYLSAFRHHKSTYYAAAVLLALFLTGVCGTLKCLCCKDGCACDLRPGHVGRGGDPVANYFCIRGCGDCCECCGDCCFFCGRGESCPDCNIGGCTCLTDMFGSCPTTTSTDSGQGACVLLLVIVIAVLVIAFILVGLILVFMAIVVWFQKVVVRYLQLSELRQLAGEYVVEDLSGKFPAAEAPLKCNVENPAPSAPPQESMPDNPSVHPSGSPIHDSNLVHQSLRRDLQAVYGRDTVF